MRPLKGVWLLILFLLVTLSVSPVFAVGYVYDDAHMFSQATVDTISHGNDQMLASVKKEFVVITVPSVTGSWQDAMRQHIGDRPVNGVLVFIDVGAKKTYVAVDNKTREVFGPSQEQALKDAINNQFKQGHFDAGITSGMAYVQSTLSADSARSQPVLPMQRNMPMQQQPPARSSGGFGLFGLILLLLFIWVVVSILKALFRGGQSVVNNYGGGGVMPGPGYNPGYGGPGYPVQQGGGGGGFWSSLLGGAGGAIVGNALYDKFERRPENEGYMGPVAPDQGGGYVAPSQPDWQNPGTSMDTSDSGSSWGSSSDSSSSSDSGSSWGDSGGSSGGGGGGSSDWS